MSNNVDTQQERIGDEEILYRSVRQRQDDILYEEGALRVSPQAFADKNRQPSLYRHILYDTPPYSNPPRMGPDQAVVSLIAGRIRQDIGTMEHQPEKQAPILYVIDVKPDTSNNQHPSHAIVFANPAFQTRGAFEKLKRLLVKLVKDWAIPPDEGFLEQLRAESRKGE